MKEAKTLKGKVFWYDGNLTEGLLVYPTKKDNESFTGTIVKISKDEIDFIKKEIRLHTEIPMGACRDNPKKGSLGEKLKRRKKSPQILSYVIPLLKEEGFCRTFKDGRAFIVRLCK